MHEKRCVAVIGCGSIANNAHLPLLHTNPDVRLKYAVDLIEARAKHAVEQYGAEQALTDYRAALEDPEVDAVFVLTPNYSHATISIDALKKGKHVFCEKPITVNYELSQKMAAAARDAGKILNIGVCNRFNRSIELIRKMIEEGRLGEVYHVYCSFRSYRSIPGLGGDFTTKAVAGGGVLIDWGVHFLDLILYATGLPKVRTVSANDYCRLGKDIGAYTYLNMWAGPEKTDGIYDVDDFVSGFVRTDGPSISFNGAWAQNIDREEMFVDFLGDKAGIRLTYGGKFELYTAESGVLQTIQPKYNLNNHYESEQLAFFASIATGEKTRAHIDHVLESARLLDAIYESGRQKKEVIL